MKDNLIAELREYADGLIGDGRADANTQVRIVIGQEIHEILSRQEAEQGEGLSKNKHGFLPCPFCGSDDVGEGCDNCGPNSRYDEPNVTCNKCGARSRGEYGRYLAPEVIAAWNTRPTPPKPTELLAEIHIGFSDRLRLEDEYLVWAKNNGVVVRPSSVITWAQSKGLLNTKVARAYLEGLADKEVR